jgi:hypothetical protein
MVHFEKICVSQSWREEMGLVHDHRGGAWDSDRKKKSYKNKAIILVISKRPKGQQHFIQHFY